MYETFIVNLSSFRKRKEAMEVTRTLERTSIKEELIVMCSSRTSQTGLAVVVTVIGVEGEGETLTFPTLTFQL